MAVDDLAITGGVEMAVTLRSHGWCRLTALVRSESADSKANGEACEAKRSSSHFDKLKNWTEGRQLALAVAEGPVPVVAPDGGGRATRGRRASLTRLA